MKPILLQEAVPQNRQPMQEIRKNPAVAEEIVATGPDACRLGCRTCSARLGPRWRPSVPRLKNAALDGGSLLGLVCAAVLGVLLLGVAISLAFSFTVFVLRLFLPGLLAGFAAVFAVSWVVGKRGMSFGRGATTATFGLLGALAVLLASTIFGALWFLRRRRRLPDVAAAHPVAGGVEALADQPVADQPARLRRGVACSVVGGRSRSRWGAKASRSPG